MHRYSETVYATTFAADQGFYLFSQAQLFRHNSAAHRPPDTPERTSNGGQVKPIPGSLSPAADARTVPQSVRGDRTVSLICPSGTSDAARCCR